MLLDLYSYRTFLDTTRQESALWNSVNLPLVVFIRRKTLRGGISLEATRVEVSVNSGVYVAWKW